MRFARLVLRVLGWLLTPLVAWAASFFGATAGASLAARFADVETAFGVTIACGAVAAFGAVILWLRLLRQSPRIQHTLHVMPDGAPDPAALEEPAAPPEPVEGGGGPR